MTLAVRAFPLRGSVADLKAFASELRGARAGDAAKFYQRYGASREVWHLQQTDHGPWVIGVTELANPGEAAPKFAGSTDEFDAWFKARVLSLTGVDQNTAPLGPPTTEVFAWSSKE